MAITILSNPSSFMAAHNQVPYTVSSNMTGQPNFNFIIDINQTSGTNNPLARLKYPVQPSSAQITFDIGNVLKNYVSYDFNNVSAVFAPNTNSRLKYYVEFRELYDVWDGTQWIPTLQSISARHPTTPSSTSFNLATNTIFDFEDYSSAAMVGKSVSNIGFLSNGNSLSENIKSTEERFLYWFDPSRVVKTVRYVATGGGTQDVSITLTSNEYLFCTRAGKYAQDVLLAADLEITNLYKVQLLDGSGNVIATKTFNLNTECSIYGTTRLHWLNKLGGFDSFNFIRNSTKTEDIERKQFKAPLSIGYTKQDRLKTNYNTTINDKINIQSDWISEQQSTLFEELVSSPIIYLERNPTSFVAVNIINTNYEFKNYLNNRKLFNLSLDIEYTYSRYRQSL